MKNNKGFSLVEIMVSLPIALVVLGAVGAAIAAFYTMSSRTKDNISSDQEMNLMVNSLRTAARSGINVRYTTQDLRGTGSQGTEGYVYGAFNYLQFSNLTGSNPFPLMYFARETATDTVSRPRAAALFFIPPTATTPGQLQLSLANADGPQTLHYCPVTGACTANPPPAIILNNVMGVRLFEHQYSPTALLMTSVKMSITVRSFITTSDKPKRFCPQADFATQCADGAPYRDFVRTIVLQFDNNRQESLTRGLDLPYGVYFFRSGGPRWSN